MQKIILIKSGLFVAFSVIALSPLLMHKTKGDEPYQPMGQWEANLVSISESADLTPNEPDLIHETIEIPEDLLQPNITVEEIKRGWYSASREGRKYGTPASWVFVFDDFGPKWTSPEGQQADQILTNDNLCEQTGGQRSANSNTECSCSESTMWQENQGCILKGSRGSLIAINQKEIEAGHYQGKINEKKLNTPPDWQWLEEGENSTWRKP